MWTHELAPLCKGKQTVFTSFLLPFGLPHDIIKVYLIFGKTREILRRKATGPKNFLIHWQPVAPWGVL